MDGSQQTLEDAQRCVGDPPSRSSGWWRLRPVVPGLGPVGKPQVLTRGRDTWRMPMENLTPQT